MKKLFLRSVFLFASILFGENLHAQWLQTGNTSTATSCDGYAVIYDSICDYTQITWSQDTIALSSDSLFITGLCTGSYTVALSGSGTCADTTIHFTIGTTPCGGFGASVHTSQQASQGACNGALTATASNGAAPYSYSWNTGATTATAGNLCLGMAYYVTVTDANGCTANTIGTVAADTTVVSDSCNGFMAWITSIQPPSQAGVCDGWIGVGAMSGVMPYTYSWSNGSTQGFIDNACADSAYTVTVTDAAGCTYTVSTTVPDTIVPCDLNVSITSVLTSTPTSCDGSLTAHVSGGHAPYTYSWSNGATAPVLNNVCGTYLQLDVTDSLGCTATAWGSTIGDTLADSSLYIYVYTTPVSEDGECDGTLTVNGWGGHAPYTYVLSNGATNTTGYFDSLCQGIYTAYVFDSYGDSVSMDLIISNPGNTYTNYTYSDSIVIDSILGALQANCQLNYQDIDSVFITGYEIVGSSLLVHWSIVTGTGTTVISQIYQIGGGYGVYSLGLQVYCPGKVLGNYFTATDQIYYGGALGVAEKTLQEALVYPNPVSDRLHVKLERSGEYTAVLYDLMGREILSISEKDADHLLLDVSGLARGQYTLKISNNDGFVSRSIIK